MKKIRRKKSIAMNKTENGILVKTDFSEYIIILYFRVHTVHPIYKSGFHGEQTLLTDF